MDACDLHRGEIFIFNEFIRVSKQRIKISWLKQGGKMIHDAVTRINLRSCKIDDFFLTDATSNRADSNISYRDRTRFRKMLELIIQRDLRVVDFHSGCPEQNHHHFLFFLIFKTDKVYAFRERETNRRWTQPPLIPLKIEDRTIIRLPTSFNNPRPIFLRHMPPLPPPF